MTTLPNRARLKPRVGAHLRSYRPARTPYTATLRPENLAALGPDSDAMSFSQFQALLLEAINSANLNA